MFDAVSLEKSSTTEPHFPCTFLYGSYCVCYGRNKHGMVPPFEIYQIQCFLLFLFNLELSTWKPVTATELGGAYAEASWQQ